MKVQKQTHKFLKPFVPTPSTFRHYKLGLIDEFVGVTNVGVVLFFVDNSLLRNSNFLDRLETSLEKTLTRFYPLAGRYVDETKSVDCGDQGVEFTYASVNVTLQDLLDSQETVNLIDEFVPSKIRVAIQRSDPLLATQVTSFKCGGLSIGVSCPHKIVDASTLSTFINEWAITNHEDDESESKLTNQGFISPLLFPSRGLCSSPVRPVTDDTLTNYTTKKVSFSESIISSMKLAKGKNSKWSKVQLVAGIIWNAFNRVDLAKNDHRTTSMLVQAVNLRGKMASLVPKNACGNLWGVCATLCKNHQTTQELVDLLSDHVKKTLDDLSTVHHDSEEGQEMVLNSLLSMRSMNHESTSVIIVTSWCKFGFYEGDFGFGKPIWVAPRTIPAKNSVYLMDDVEGNGVEAYVFLEGKDLLLFEEAIEYACQRVLSFITM